MCGNLARHWSQKFSKDQQGSGKRREDLDGVEPGCAFTGAEAPPFPSNLGIGAVSANGNKQKGEKECDAKDVERNHPGTRKAENRDRHEVQLAPSDHFYDVGAQAQVGCSRLVYDGTVQE